jgi:biopolymer transport protein TolR
MGLSRNGPEINVTPLIDVLLVLLVIFIVVMPAMLRMEQVEVPRSAPPEDVEPFAYLTVKIHADQSVTMTDDGNEIRLVGADLPASLRQHLRSQIHIVFVEFEDAVPWRDVVGTIDTVRGVSGDAHVALKVEP